VTKSVRFIVILLAIITLIINEVLPFNSPFIEQFYSNGLFLAVRTLHDNTLGRLPFPTIYLLFGCLMGLAIRYIYRHRNIRRKPWHKTIIQLISHVITLLCIILTLFYWLWAFNYKRQSFEHKNNLVKSPITEEWLFDELRSVHDSLYSLRTTLNFRYDHQPIESEIRRTMKKHLASLGYSTHGEVRVREIHPKGNLLIWSTAGVYLPFVSEGHIDAGLPELVKPFTLAHEMTHGYGEGSESVCNFIAFLTCIRSHDLSVRYSGWLGYFRYLLSACRRTNPEVYQSFRNNEMSELIEIDLETIYVGLQKYPDLLPKLRYLIYDSYLKSHGVSEGMLSYSHMIRLAKMWDAKFGSYLAR